MLLFRKGYSEGLEQVITDIALTQHFCGFKPKSDCRDMLNENTSFFHDAITSQGVVSLG